MEPDVLPASPVLGTALPEKSQAVGALHMEHPRPPCPRGWTSGGVLEEEAECQRL